MPPIHMITLVLGALIAAGITVLAATTFAPKISIGLLLIIPLAASVALRIARKPK